MADKKTPSKVEAKVEETLSEMGKSAEKAIDSVIEETQKEINEIEVKAPVVVEEEEPAPVVEEEPAPVVEEEGDKPGEEEGDKPGEEEGDKPGEEEGDKPGEETLLDKIKTLIKNENNFNYVSFGSHFKDGINDDSLRAFYDEFSISGMLSSQNHYDLLKNLKTYFSEE